MNLNSWLVQDMLFMKIQNKNGASIDPCGTPVVITDLSEAMAYISTYCCLFVK